MEIEAKFRIDDEQVLEELATLGSLGPFRFVPAGVETQLNTYLDTADGRLRAGRYGLRVRDLGDRRIATLKGEAREQDGLYERDEWEVEIGGDDRPEAWPDHEVRERVLALTGGAPVEPILVIRTIRHKIEVLGDAGRVAELALDRGTIAADGQTEELREVEVELRDEGARSEFDELVRLLRDRYPLTPEHRSKLARGLALLDSASATRAAGAPEEAPLIAIALALFDAVADPLQLPSKARRYLSAAAACYAAGLASGADRADRAGRNLALAAPLDRFDPEERCLVASAVAMQRAKPRLERETAYLRLDEHDQSLARRLGAVLWLAEGLSVTPVPAVAAQVRDGQTLLVLDGPAAGAAIELAEPRAGQWRSTFSGLTLRHGEVGLAEALGAQRLRLDAAPSTTPGLSALVVPEELTGDEPAAEGARRMLRRQFEKMLAREEEVRSGEDAEDVHQMRVATRRLRASLQIVEPLFETGRLRRLRRSLRLAAAALGEVRDRDVFLAHLLESQAGRLARGEAGLHELIEAVAGARTEARAALLESLDSPRYTKFKHDFARFLTTPGEAVAELPEVGVAPRVRDVAGSMIWRRYEELRAFEVVVPHGPSELLHRARIAGKRLRYTLEFFAEALGPGADDVLEPLVALQETLGNLQDAVVAREHVHALGLEDDEGAQSYLDERGREHERTLGELPDRWSAVVSENYRRRLFKLIIRM